MHACIHMQANGFYGSKGISYYIPAAYTRIETQFLRHVERRSATDRVRVHEYARPGWTFHAKGAAHTTA
jgi:CDP-diacylglycerol---glycerol-3-phosphate 3-phosphatidyltransferase